MGDLKNRISNGPVAGRLTGKIIMITGAGGGLGQDAAVQFARAGATVLANDINQRASKRPMLMSSD